MTRYYDDPPNGRYPIRKIAAGFWQSGEMQGQAGRYLAMVRPTRHKDAKPHYKEVRVVGELDNDHAAWVLPVWWASPEQVTNALNTIHCTASEWIFLQGGTRLDDPDPAQYNLAPLCNELASCGYRIACQITGVYLGHLSAKLDYISAVLPLRPNLIKFEALTKVDELIIKVSSVEEVRKIEKTLEGIRLKQGASVTVIPLTRTIRDQVAATVLALGYRLGSYPNKRG